MTPGPQPCPPDPRDVDHGLPTLEQQEAIALLSGQDVGDVFAYLKYARSAIGSPRCREGSRGKGEGLSLEQVEAIKTLSNCADRKLRTWLRDDRVTTGDRGTLNGSQSSPPSAFHYEATRHPSAVPGHWSGSQSSSTVPSHTQPPASLVERPYLYRCTLCNESRSYKNDSDWKKHEKEHEYTYMCTPDGWLGVTGSRPECVICGVQDPNGQHAMEHNAEACSFRCKRREHMTKHLNKCHGVYDTARGCTLAKNWLRGSGRQFWSCGLCVSLFPSLQERLKHIDVKHFRRHESVEGWNVTTVIHGLLKQPGVCEVWEAQITAQHGWQHPQVVWEAAKLGDLQFKLEMGPSDKQSAVLLAKAVLDACTTRNSHAWNDTPDPADDGHKRMDIGPISFSSHSQSVSTHATSTDPLAADLMPWEVQDTLTHSRSGEAHGYDEEPALFEPVFDASGYANFRLDLNRSKLTTTREEAIFNQPADPILFSDMGNHDFADIEQW